MDPLPGGSDGSISWSRCDVYNFPVITRASNQAESPNMGGE